MVKKNKAGFTLVEVLVVMCLVSITFFGYTGSKDALRRQTYKQFLQDTSDFIMKTQQLATLKNVTYTIGVGKEDEKAYLEASRHRTEYVLPIPSGMSVAISTSEETIVFSQDMSPTKGATFQITDHILNEKTDITVIPATGNVTIK